MRQLVLYHYATTLMRGNETCQTIITVTKKGDAQRVERAMNKDGWQITRFVALTITITERGRG